MWMMINFYLIYKAEPQVPTNINITPASRSAIVTWSGDSNSVLYLY